MLLVVPVKTLLTYFAFGMSTYSLFTFLLTASPLEIQFLGVLLNLVSVGLGIFIASRIINELAEMEHAISQMGGCRVCRCCDGTIEENNNQYSEEDTEATEVAEATESEETPELYVQTQRHVEEVDGKLIITTTYESILEDETEEVREMVENSPTEPSPTEETAEFADLLAEKKVN